MTSIDDLSPLLHHGGYRKLRSYKLAQAVYDATVVFCRRFFQYDHRMSGQMVQAARSGVRNISEGSGAAATSRKTEMKLTNVARASLSDELLPDFESFLRQRGLRVWHKDSREARLMRERLMHDHDPRLPPPAAGTARLKGLHGLADFVAEADPEFAGNAMLCALNQAVYLLSRQLRSQGRAFTEEGGFTESLYHRRRRALEGTQVSGEAMDADSAGTPGKPDCPVCGKPMVRRAGRKGSRAGQVFWGCRGYPECKGTRPLSAAARDRHRSEKVTESGIDPDSDSDPDPDEKRSGEEWIPGSKSGSD